MGPGHGESEDRNPVVHAGIRRQERTVDDHVVAAERPGARVRLRPCRSPRWARPERYCPCGRRSSHSGGRSVQDRIPGRGPGGRREHGGVLGGPGVDVTNERGPRIEPPPRARPRWRTARTTLRTGRGVCRRIPTTDRPERQPRGHDAAAAAGMVEDRGTRPARATSTGPSFVPTIVGESARCGADRCRRAPHHRSGTGPVGIGQPVALAGRGYRHRCDPVGDRHVAERPIEGGVAEGEDAAVRGDHPVTVSGRGRRHRDDGFDKVDRRPSNRRTRRRHTRRSPRPTPPASTRDPLASAPCPRPARSDGRRRSSHRIRVAEGEDPAIRGHQPVALARRGGRHPDDGGVEADAAG